MSRPNEALRKASRPLSIIDENPDDVRGYSKTMDDVTMKESSLDEPRTKESLSSSHFKPTRRKAVAPLRHPVNLLLPFTGNNEKQAVINSDVITKLDTVQCAINSSITGDETSLSDCDSESKINDNGCFHRADNSNSDSGIDIFIGDQFLDADELYADIDRDKPTQRNNNCHLNVLNTPLNSSFQENQRISRFNNSNSSDTRKFDENGNVNFKSLYGSKFKMSPNNSWVNTNNCSASFCSEESTENESSIDQLTSSGIFYLSNSTSSLDTDLDEEKANKYGYKYTFDEQMPKETSEAAQKVSIELGIADAEEIEWKNRVKRSRSFIKNHINALRPMRRSISATFSNSSKSGVNDISMNENNTHSPGTLRRSCSLQIDSSFHTNDMSQSRSFLSFLGNGFDKSRSESLQKASNILSVCSNTKHPANISEDDQPVRRISTIDQSDFGLLKVTANQLHLQTRRPSVMAWKEKYMSNSFQEYSLDRWTKFKNAETADNMEWTDENVERINTSLSMLRQELIDLRLQDQSLARQFLGLRHAMNALRLTLQCKDHKELLDDAEDDIEELRELSQLVDLPPELLSPVTSLQNLGITRMNLSSRRFSTC